MKMFEEVSDYSFA